MINSLLLTSAARVLTPIQAVIAVYLLLRGHNLPGGGFIAGLCAGGGAVLWFGTMGCLPFGLSIEQAVRRSLFGGWMFMLLSGIAGPLYGLDFMQVVSWWSVETFIFGKLVFGTALLFDLGVCLSVFGFACVLLKAEGKLHGGEDENGL